MNPVCKAMRYFDSLSTPLGEIYLIFSGEALAGVSFKRPRAKAGRAPEHSKKQFEDYFAGRLTQFRQELTFEGTEFEKTVWLALKDVPYGETRTYKWLAEKVGRPGGARAVGQALSRNPLPIVLPCHRIIESDGGLGGYSSGEDIKRRLLSLEYYHSGKGG